MSAKRDKIAIKKFAQEVVKNGCDTTKAMKICNPHLDSNAIAVKKHNWLKDPDVYDAVIKEMQALGLTREQMACVCKARLLGIISDKGEKTADVVTAIDKMAKFEGIYSDSQTTNNIILNDIGDRLRAIKSVKSMPNADEKPATTTPIIDITPSTSST